MKVQSPQTNTQIARTSFLINMADSFVADSLLRKLASGAYEEAFRAYGVVEDLEGIKRTLSIIRAVLSYAEESMHRSDEFRKWQRLVANTCYNTEDVLEGFELQDKRKQVVKASGSTSMKVGRYFSSFINPLVFRHRMAPEIKEIRDRLDKVAADGTKFGRNGSGLDAGRRETNHSYIDESRVIGRENDREEIVNILMQPHADADGDKSLGVIPIVGVAGLGKTTLAKLAFNDKRIDQHFQLKMWVDASHDFDIKHMVIKILYSAPALGSTLAHQQHNLDFDTEETEDRLFNLSFKLAYQKNLENSDTEELQFILRHMLSGQKFLLVLDDVRNENQLKWIQLKDLIKVGVLGSKIMVTTCSNLIASMMGTIPPYVLEVLSPENCLSLFVRSAFVYGEEQKYPHLVEIGKEIVKKAHGVPLAVEKLGYSLFSKYSLNTWERVRKHGIWGFENSQRGILQTLKLSYDQMPSYLRQCFTYFSLYPKDFTFNSDEIISLWVAFGLVHSLNGREKLEDIARRYIDELNSRLFLQDFVDYGYYCTFKVYGSMHDLALYVSEEEFEFVVVNSDALDIPEQAKHISIVENVSLGHVSFPESKNVRTILFPIGGVGLDSESLLDIWVSRYKYLRVLDLSKSSLETLPNSIAQLEYLCVLDLSCNRKIKRLPRSICKLSNLQVLSLDGCKEFEILPKGLGKLISLRQLFITTKQYVLSLNEFASLNHLRALKFCCCHNLKLLFSRKQQLTSLETLIIQSCGSLESLPLYIFPKLETLSIANCQMLNLSLNNESPFQKLRMKHLHLVDFSGLLTFPQWIGSATDTLETFVIYKFLKLERLPECLTTMTHLKRLHIVDCPQLLSLPSEMHRLSALEDLVIDGCPELYPKCQQKSGEYWTMIAHIKSIFIGEPRGEEE